MCNMLLDLIDYYTITVNFRFLKAGKLKEAKIFNRGKCVFTVCNDHSDNRSIKNYEVETFSIVTCRASHGQSPFTPSQVYKIY